MIRISTSGAAQWPADDQRAGSDDAPARALRTYKVAFARALDRGDDDAVTNASDQLGASAVVEAALGTCVTWEQLIRLQDEWAEARAKACMVEAARLVRYADRIRDPRWLTRQVRVEQDEGALGLGVLTGSTRRSWLASASSTTPRTRTRNTTRGVGDDISAAGDALSKSAEKNKGY